MAGQNEAVFLATDFLSIRQIANVLGVSVNSARRTVLFQIPYVRCGSLIRVRREAFDAWWHKQEIKSGNKRKEQDQ